MIIIKPSVEIEKVDGIAMLKRIEKAGRTCYKSEKNITEDSAKSFVKKLIKNGHESVIEHEKITATIICDRGVSHEVVRHRIASYSQESTRYVDYKNTEEPMQFIDIEPFMNAASLSVWVETMTYIENAYNKLRKLGVTPQIARSVLPNSLKTEIVMTCNLREWRHFFKVRCAKASHPQMREVTIELLKKMKEVVPVVFDDLIFE
jgi:thymidylate synthase (FAD)